MNKSIWRFHASFRVLLRSQNKVGDASCQPLNRDENQ
jgi:hypothetical protein